MVQADLKGGILSKVRAVHSVQHLLVSGARKAETGSKCEKRKEKREREERGRESMCERYREH